MRRYVLCCAAIDADQFHHVLKRRGAHHARRAVRAPDPLGMDAAVHHLQCRGKYVYCVFVYIMIKGIFRCGMGRGDLSC